MDGELKIVKTKKFKVIIAKALTIIMGILLTIMVWIQVKPNPQNSPKGVSLNIQSQNDMSLQLFYSDKTNFSGDRIVSEHVNGNNALQNISLPLNEMTKYLRFDFGDSINEICISEISVSVGKVTKAIPLELFLNSNMSSDINKVTLQNGKLNINVLAPDPFIIVDISNLQLLKSYEAIEGEHYFVYKAMLSLWIALLVMFCLKNIHTIFRTPLDIYRDREMFWNLAKNDFQARFSGSYFGVFWGFIQPITLLLMYWFVFQVGMRAGSVVGYPFILYLMAGLIPWFFFSEAWSSATNSLYEYSYLVKKVVFNVNLLPVIKVTSSIFIHVFFVAILLVTCCLYGYFPNVYSLQLILYILLLFIYTLGLSYITSACTVFFKDLAQVVNIILTVGVWITPIMWNIVMLNPTLQIIFKLNPMFYIVDGFRDALLTNTLFWEKPIWTVYSVSFIVFIYIVGVKLYEKLKCHFADVL